MKSARIHALLPLLAALMVALPVTAQTADTGQADFSKYVALGDSLSAGFWSNGLAVTQQVYSYPALLYGQVEGTDQGFEQPTISEPGIPAQLELTSLIPLTIQPKAGIGVPLNLTLPQPYDNLAIPGANLNDVLYRICDDPGGVFFDLILRNPGCGPARGEPTGGSALDQALSQSPTFATVWIGANDALGAAVSGLVIDGVTLTPAASFAFDDGTLIDALDSSGVQLAIANVPDVTSIPYVTTVPTSVDVGGGTIVPLTAVTHPAPFNPAVTATRTLGPGDYVLLPAQTLIPMGVGLPGGPPLGDDMVLDAVEVDVIRTRIAGYNQVIADKAAETGAALVDINGILSGIAANGTVIGGIDYDASFLTGGVFSLDGVHPNPLGQGLVVNAFIAAINARFGASIPLYDLYPVVFGGDAGIVLPSAMAAEVSFSPEAAQAMREALGVPPTETLIELAQRPLRPSRNIPRGGPGRPRDARGARR